MGAAAVVEIESGDAAGCARRMLSALADGSRPRMERELIRSERLCARGGHDSSLAEEQAELLNAVVEGIRLHHCGETEILLLGHLASA